MSNYEGLRTPDEILRVALEKEAQARDFYGDLSAHCSVDFVKELLLKLHNEESKHWHMIQDMLGKLAAGKSLV